MFRCKESDDAVGFTVIGVMEDDGWGNIQLHELI